MLYSLTTRLGPNILPLRGCPAGSGEPKHDEGRKGPQGLTAEMIAFFSIVVSCICWYAQNFMLRFLTSLPNDKCCQACLNTHSTYIYNIYIYIKCALNIDYGDFFCMRLLDEQVLCFQEFVGLRYWHSLKRLPIAATTATRKAETKTCTEMALKCLGNSIYTICIYLYYVLMYYKCAICAICIFWFVHIRIQNIQE